MTTAPTAAMVISRLMVISWLTRKAATALRAMGQPATTIASTAMTAKSGDAMPSPGSNSSNTSPGSTSSAAISAARVSARCQR